MKVEVISYTSDCQLVDLYLDTTKIPDHLKKEALTISCVVQQLIAEEDEEEIEGMLNTVSVVNQVTPEAMAENREKILSSD